MYHKVKCYNLEHYAGLWEMRQMDEENAVIVSYQVFFQRPHCCVEMIDADQIAHYFFDGNNEIRTLLRSRNGEVRSDQTFRGTLSDYIARLAGVSHLFVFWMPEALYHDVEVHENIYRATELELSPEGRISRYRMLMPGGKEFTELHPLLEVF